MISLQQYSLGPDKIVLQIGPKSGGPLLSMSEIAAELHRTLIQTPAVLLANNGIVLESANTVTGPCCKEFSVSNRLENQTTMDILGLSEGSSLNKPRVPSNDTVPWFLHKNNTFVQLSE